MGTLVVTAIVLGFVGGGAVVLLGLLMVRAIRRGAGRVFRRGADRKRERPAMDTPRVELIAERVRVVGRLVGLEVCVKEIATATRGWAWLPPIVLSQARLAMIFRFEKQYSVDLSRLREGDVTLREDGGVRIVLPELEGRLRLVGVTPYDIQDGRVLGLLDVIPMNAARQAELMSRAQEQAASLYGSRNPDFEQQAREGVERHLGALLRLVGVDATFAWRATEGAAVRIADDASGAALCEDALVSGAA
ncbi:MAG: DUF4230 domain-containing protein [Phycisphaerales bacterium]|jgi:hypothetical protein|nr:DUF4230 domain-containing protein [Phycisphaerales bacterium]